MRPRICPKLETCRTLLDRNEFLSNCVDDWEKCPINSLRFPRMWILELREELITAGIVDKVDDASLPVRASPLAK